ncbi:hypothetical protein Pcinc_040269 [Petrolisthes cinctipes]|uniref:Uncharacterized protein n=1 Tax=Petrolisthes cinctipes TaxID=88211 RepID=A0AAE1BLY6_PETCI|nr:hypothetical protein Pcinc_040269 [Petrolisthes cinctipes]
MIEGSQVQLRELIMQIEAHLTALNVEIADRALHVKELLGEQKKMVAECCRKLGNDNDLIPCIMRLDLNISNQPLDTEIAITVNAFRDRYTSIMFSWSR